MSIKEMLFGTKCAECGQRIKGERFPALGPGWMCHVCHDKLEADRKRREEEKRRQELERRTLEPAEEGKGQSAAAGPAETPLDALIIIFTREFSPKEMFVNSILTKMNARGRSYRDWMTDGTPVRILVDPRAQDPTKFIATAMVQFRMLIGQFAVERLEHATFEGSHGISGVILSHWKN